ncbi:MAG: phosphate acetyltransferase [Pantoea sp. Brub]|nr:phosphate acetyltransferase [Pantoea sp. Brub]
MPRTIILIPTNNNVGLTTITIGVIRSMERKGIRVNFFKPIEQSYVDINSLNQTSTIILKKQSIPINQPLNKKYVKFLLSNNKYDILMEKIIAKYHSSKNTAEVILIEGLMPTNQLAIFLNYEIAKVLNAEIILILTPKNDTLLEINEQLKLVQNIFSNKENKNIIGVIVNKINAPIDVQNNIHYFFSNKLKSSLKLLNTNNNLPLFHNSSVPIIASIPWNFDLIAARAIDMYNHLNAVLINEGELKTRRIKSITFCSYSLPNMLKYFHKGSLLVTSADRPDVLVAACLATMNGVEIAAILLTGNHKINNQISKLCERAFKTGLPVFMVKTNTWQTSLNIQQFDLKIPVDDVQRIENIQEYVANFINSKWIESLTVNSKNNIRLSPPAFRYKLTQLARKSKTRIVLPEGEEPRTIKAASICASKNITTCILLGNPDEIKRIAILQGIKLGKNIELINPILIRNNYIPRLIELRKHKGMNHVLAEEQLKDNVVLGTMMLEQNEVDGLVSGAIHTTANTIRPSLQLIKTAPNNSLISSIFFMLLPEEVLVYGDCAINPDPTSVQLAEIAIQSADSAKAFGIEPRVAMISYSTGNSSEGSDVEKVRQATIIAKQKRPDLIIDGPLQYDAAIIEDVAKHKAPHSQVAGKATVLIFPDLNTGNTTYKAVQRTANLTSIGPMLQGINKPVNDLSRGALVDDIVYTIALTAIQSQKMQNKNKTRF